jgi:exodeoxyribonuclease VII large subunit
VAEFLVATLADAESDVERVADRLVREARRAVAESAARLGRVESRALVARRRLERAAGALATLAEALRRAAGFRLRSASLRLDGWARLVAGLSPAKTLSRGFSLTRDASGAVVRDAAAVELGALLTTEFANGRLRSRVEEKG